MHSIELHFPYREEFLGYQKQYSRMFRKMYSNPELMDDDTFMKECIDRNPLLDASMFGFAKIQLKMKLAQSETARKKQIELIEQYNKELGLLEKRILPEKKRKKIFFKLRKKKMRLEETVRNGHEIVFGGKYNLRKITYNKNMFVKTGDQKYLDAYNKHKKVFLDNRDLPCYFVGRANEHGNRKFNFDFIKNKIVFKPNRKEHHEININPSKSQQKILKQIQLLIDRNEMAITVSLTTTKIVITYDNELLNGFDFNSKACKSEQSHTLDKDRRKAIWVKHKKEQENRKLQGKKHDVFAGIDMNPEYIGLTIRNKKKILFTQCYDLTDLVKSMESNNTDEIKYNQAHIYKSIFSHLKHFRASNFVTEDLEFKHDETHSTGMNRKVMVAWCREFQKQLITRYTENTGIRHIQVNAAYSSFVGNLTNPFFDPISASAEIARRGMVLTKKIKEPWYPAINKLRLDNLNIETYVPDLELGDLSIPALYNVFRSRNLRYRRLVKPNSISKLIKCNIIRC